MKNNPIYYDEAAKLIRRLSEAPEDMSIELLCVNKAELEILLLSINKLLSAYLQVTEDLKELQEVSE